MKKISALFGSVVSDNSAALSINLLLKKKWSDIVGSQLTEVTSFSSARYIDQGVLSIVIETVSSAALLVKFNICMIEQNIRQLVGIQNIRTQIKHVGSIERNQITMANCNKEKEKPRYKIDIEFVNSSLKEALESLKTEMQDAV
ncbi:MAG: hypothetical protein LBT03_00880 [Holosporales bacterium]|jgi:hypothetical protein|nr:hypothetical protein [Holosporales bacterium]